MRRFQTLLIAAGLATAPVGAVAGPSQAATGSGSQTAPAARAPAAAPHAAPPIVETYHWSTSRGRLGVMVMSLTPDLRRHYGAAGDRGVLVAQVEPGSPAAKAGVAVGDVIVGVRGKAIDDATDVVSAIADAGKGDKVAIQLVRDGAARTIDVQLTADAPPAISAAPGNLDEWPGWMRDMMRQFEMGTEHGPGFAAPGWSPSSPTPPCHDT